MRRIGISLATTEITFSDVHKQNFQAPPILLDGARAPSQSGVPGVTSRMPPARRDMSQGAADGTATALTRPHRSAHPADTSGESVFLQRL